MANPFVHLELNTPDAPKAKQFYTALFGWHFNDMDMGAHGTYSTFRPSGAPGGGLTSMPGGSHGWLPYVGVDDIRSATAKAESLGAKSIMSNQEIPGIGWMSLLNDPTGAAIALFQPSGPDQQAYPSPEGASTTGSFVHLELNTPDLQKAKDFYSALFGWPLTDMDMGPGGTYTVFKTDTGPGGGMMSMTGAPTAWLTYVGVDDINAATEKAKALGAHIIRGPHEVPGMGSFTILTDPTGSVIALWQDKSA